DVLENELKPIRERRQMFAQDIPAVLQMLKNGSDHANEVAEATMTKVRRAIGVNYFDGLK
nr:tryptophan--tRNA ligase [Oenococcus oeni]